MAKYAKTTSTSKTSQYQLQLKTSSHSTTPMTNTTSTSTPLSAPAAAGRSPTRVRSKHDKLQPRKRLVQPSFKSGPTISISVALRGTLAHKKSSRSIKPAKSMEEQKPKSWFFEIYEEPEDHQEYHMSEWTMTQSSANLDISDDEGKSKSFCEPEVEGRGKENVDPNESFETRPPITRSMSRVSQVEPDVNSMNAEDTRTPLASLDAAEFYGEGLNATSVVLVHDDVVEAAKETAEAPIEQQEEPTKEPELEDTFTFVAPVEPQLDDRISLPVIDIPAWAKKQTLQLHAAPSQLDDQDPAIVADNLDIEIWESESAKDENEQQEEECSTGHIVVREGQTICLSEVSV